MHHSGFDALSPLLCQGVMSSAYSSGLESKAPLPPVNGTSANVQMKRSLDCLKGPNQRMVITDCGVGEGTLSAH